MLSEDKTQVEGIDMIDGSSLRIFAPEESMRERAIELSKRIRVPLATTRGEVFDADLTLIVSPDGLLLTDGNMELRPDFEHELPRLNHNRVSQELLVKATRTKGFGASPLAVDATAGLGEDSLLLAASGFRVILFEQNPVIAALLEDAIERARKSSHKTLAQAAQRMELRAENSIAALPHLDRKPDAVILDPMFPARTKSAQVKKKFQLLHHLEQPCANEKELMEAAKAAGPRKIVVKRPLKAPVLAGVKPSYRLEGKAIRYDIIVL